MTTKIPEQCKHGQVKKWCDICHPEMNEPKHPEISDLYKPITDIYEQLLAQSQAQQSEMEALRAEIERLKQGQLTSEAETEAFNKALVVCSADKCIAQEFREKYPNYSFTTVGYSISPIELNKEYQKLVDISYGDNYRGSEETHNCKICKKEVYDKTHR